MFMSKLVSILYKFSNVIYIPEKPNEFIWLRLSADLSEFCGIPCFFVNITGFRESCQILQARDSAKYQKPCYISDSRQSHMHSFMSLQSEKTGGSVHGVGLHLNFSK